MEGASETGDQPTVADLLLARSDDDHPGLRFEDRQWTWQEVVAESAARASYLQGLGSLDPPHVGVLLGNVPEYVFWLGATALAGTTLVGVNATRRGQALADDVVRTDCRLVLTDADGAALLDGSDLGPAVGRVIRVDQDAYRSALSGHADRTAAAVIEETKPVPSDLFLLLFTSGTTGAPKAVRCTQGRLAAIAIRAASLYGFERADVAYCTLPLFHGNSLMVLWGPSLAVGATVALARRFSASGFIPDVRRHGATTFTYVGKALAYVLATPSSPDDATCSLRRGFGTEASVADRAAFERRFGCVLSEGYGSSEGGVAISPTPGMPPGALGLAPDDVVILDPETKAECPPAIFDDQGALLNAEDAVGEIVSRDGAARFEGYYKDPEASADRVRDDLYWTGDLAYRDTHGFVFFAGRRGDWLRVDSENFTAGPVERVLVRHPDLAAVAVYSVPDPRSGDQVMAAVELLPSRTFDPGGFGRFLGDQPDLGTKWAPAYVRVTVALPQTASGKVKKDGLRREGWWSGDDPVYRRDDDNPGGYRLLTDADSDRLRAEFGLHGRAALIGG